MIDSTFEERIQKLEQANAELRRAIGEMQRRRRRVWIAGIAIVALVAVAGAAAFTGDSFHLTHPTSNKERVTFVTNPEGKTAGLWFLDEKGGKARIFVGHGDDDTPTVRLTAPDGKMLRSNMAVGDDNSVGLHLFGRTGKEIVTLGITAANQFTLQLHRPDGKNFAAINMPEKGSSGGLIFFDSDEKPRLAVGLDSKDEPMIRFFAADGSMAKELRAQ